MPFVKGFFVVVLKYNVGPLLGIISNLFFRYAK